MVSTNLDTVMFSRAAMVRNPSQNWSSKDTLDLCPSRMIERFMTSEFIRRDV
jgi:hypothetical protein